MRVVCPLHEEDLTAFDKDKALGLCRTCLEHHEGEIMTLDELKDAHITKAERHMVERHKDRIIASFNEWHVLLEQELMMIMEQVKTLKPIIEDKETYVQKYDTILEESLMFLRRQQQETSSVSLKYKLQHSIDELCKEDDVDKEEEIHRLEESYHSQARKLDFFKHYILWLSLLCGLLEESHWNEDPLLVRYIVFTFRNFMLNQHTVDRFHAFNMVHKIPGISAAAQQPVQEISPGLLSSVGIAVEGLPRNLNNIILGVSQSGDLAISTGFVNCFVYFHNFLTGEDSRIRTKKAYITPHFYKDNVYLLPHGDKQIYFSDMKTVYQNQSFRLFKRVLCPGAWNWSDNTFTPSTGILRYVTVKYQICEIDLDTLDYKILKDVFAGEIPSTTGIDTGVDFIYKYDSSVYAVTDFTHKLKLLDGIRLIQLIIPSQSNPYDLESALYITGDGDTVYYRYKDVNVTRVEELPFSCQICLIRLYKDVFLFYDFLRDKWYFKRISVP